MREYTAMVRARLGMRPLRETRGTPALQLVFLPSFHPEVAIAVERDAEGWRVELRTCQTNLYQYEQFQAAVAKGAEPAWEVPRAPELTTRRGEVSREMADRIAALLSTTDLSRWSSEGLGIDGMSVHCSHRERSGTVTQADVWLRGQKEAPGPHALVNTLFDAACSLLPDAVVQMALEGLHGYLDRGLPAAITSEEPVTARIFGGLSVHDEGELGEFLRGLPSGEPVLMDMSNAGHMGTLLYPLFREFLANRSAPTAWLVNETARQQLRAAGISETTMASTPEAARALLGT